MRDRGVRQAGSRPGGLRAGPQGSVEQQDTITPRAQPREAQRDRQERPVTRHKVTTRTLYQRKHKTP